jgi:peptidoglycan glycosyltransferase
LSLHLVRRIGDEWVHPAPPDWRLDAEPSVATAMIDALEAVVMHPRGTGKAAAVRGIRIAGKTGTAQNPHGEDHALFAGFAPVDAPRIAFAVVVENAGHGGETAAPLAAHLIEAALVGRADLWGDVAESTGPPPRAAGE